MLLEQTSISIYPDPGPRLPCMDGFTVEPHAPWTCSATLLLSLTPHVPLMLTPSWQEFCVVAGADISRGTFVSEYAGEIITRREAQQRLREYDSSNKGHALLVRGATGPLVHMASSVSGGTPSAACLGRATFSRRPVPPPEEDVLAWGLSC
jgi:hypothetical protein